MPDSFLNSISELTLLQKLFIKTCRNKTFISLGTPWPGAAASPAAYAGRYNKITCAETSPENILGGGLWDGEDHQYRQVKISAAVGNRSSIQTIQLTS